MIVSTTLSWGACTDRGLKRSANEDSYLADAPLFLVADGMGGHEGGALASSRALDAFRPLVGRVGISADDVEQAFAAAVRDVGTIETASQAAGTTLSGVVVCESAGATYWLVLNIGDSRTYLFSDGRLQQVSIDHSAVQAMIDRGELTSQAAERHPQRNVVTRAVGGGSAAAPDYWLLPAHVGDRILVCSDGLSKELTDGEISSALASEPSAQAAATRLLHEALVHGGRDNTTVVIVDAHHIATDDDAPTAPTGSIDDATQPRREIVEGGHVDAQI